MRRLLENRWAWLALALILRLAFALKLGGRQHQIDEIGFRGASLHLARTGVLGAEGRPAAFPPVPCGFFALFFKIGDSLFWPRLGQAFVGALTVWLLGRATERLSGSRTAGRLALALAAVYPYFIYYGGMVVAETLNLALLVPGLWWLCEALERRDEGAARLAGAAGLALALSALCRAEGAYIVALIWAAAAVGCARGRWPWRAWAVGVIVWLLPLLGWSARNRAQVGVFALDLHGGISILHGTEYFELNDIDTGKAMEAIRNAPWYQAAQALPDAQRDKAYLAEALRWMRAHPAETVAQWGKKLVRFWRPIPRLDKEYTENQYSHPTAGAPRWALVVISALFEPWLILLGFAGLWSLRARLATLFPLYLWLAATTALHVLTVAQPRYRLPVMPVLMVAACALAARRLDRAAGHDGGAPEAV